MTRKVEVEGEGVGAQFLHESLLESSDLSVAGGRVHLLVGQGQLLLEAEPHGLVLLPAIAEGAHQLGKDLKTKTKIILNRLN